MCGPLPPLGGSYGLSFSKFKKLNEIQTFTTVICSALSRLCMEENFFVAQE